MKHKPITEITKIREWLRKLDVNIGTIRELDGTDTEYVHTNTLYKALGMGDVVIKSHYTPVQYCGLIIALAQHVTFYKDVMRDTVSGLDRTLNILNDHPDLKDRVPEIIQEKIEELDKHHPYNTDKDWHKD